MSLYPNRRSAVLPALRERAARARLALARGDRAGRGRDAVSARPTSSRSRASTTCSSWSPSAATRSTCARTSRASCAAQTTCSTPCRRRPGSAVGGSSPDGEFHLRAFECLGACDIAPMASIEGHYRGPLTDEDAAHDRRPPARGRIRVKRVAGKIADSPVSRRSRLDEGRAPMSPGSSSRHVEVPDLNRIDDLRAARRLSRRCARRSPR